MRDAILDCIELRLTLRHHLDVFVIEAGVATFVSLEAGASAVRLEAGKCIRSRYESHARPPETHASRPRCHSRGPRVRRGDPSSTLAIELQLDDEHPALIVWLGPYARAKKKKKKKTHAPASRH